MRVAVYAPSGILYEGDAQRVAATSTEGAFEVWEGHAPFVAALVEGEVRVFSAEGIKPFALKGGYLWVEPDGGVKVLLQQ